MTGVRLDVYVFVLQILNSWDCNLESREGRNFTRIECPVMSIYSLHLHRVDFDVLQCRALYGGIFQPETSNVILEFKENFQ